MNRTGRYIPHAGKQHLYGLHVHLVDGRTRNSSDSRDILSMSGLPMPCWQSGKTIARRITGNSMRDGMETPANPFTLQQWLVHCTTIHKCIILGVSTRLGFCPVFLHPRPRISTVVFSCFCLNVTCWNIKKQKIVCFYLEIVLSSCLSKCLNLAPFLSPSFRH